MEVLQVAATVFSVFSSISKGEEKAQDITAQSQNVALQHEANANANAYNAAVTRQRAETTTASYGQREEQQRREARVIAGKRRAAIAQSGTGFGGSNEDIDRQSQVFAELDALNIRYAGQLESSGLLAQAELDEYYGGTQTAAAGRARAYGEDASDRARTSGYMGAGAALISGAGGFMKGGSPGGAAGGGGYGPAPSIYGGYGFAY